MFLLCETSNANRQRCTLTQLSIAPSFRSRSMYRVRVVALSGLAICALVSTLHAAESDKNRFLEIAKKLVDAINGDDIPTIENMLDGQMQQVLPVDKATPFFRGIASASGKLKEVGDPVITGRT